jgi:transcriptional regulator with XRE-family HTH domain
MHLQKRERGMLRVMRGMALLDLEHQLRPLRSARKSRRPAEGWLRAMRQATGTPVDEIARDMKFTPKMVFQMERSEQQNTITLERLGKMARALQCDLVYGIVPWQRSIEDRAMELVEQGLWRKRYRR